ncbi:MAG: T9SS type A sorting domain-containing protein [Bacteroidetes bacterium]|nr:T9SS type A sorting domain-containing protein [Bacteroidota bacterium]
MKQRLKYTNPYSVSGFSIEKRKDLLHDLNAGFTSAKKFVAAISRVLFLALMFFATNSTAYSQTCPTSGTHSQSANENTYYPATASISAGATSITLGAAGSGTDFGTTPIANGDIVLIIQMQGAEISTTNSNKYGSNSNNAALNGTGMLANANLVAGYMEFAVATNAVPLAGGTLTIAAGTVNAYTSSAFGSFGQYTYQVIRVPIFYNIQLTATINTPLWNGSTGGVTVINANNQINFNGQTVSALGAGFRGGGGKSQSGAAGSNTDYVTLSTITVNGAKGEGIAGTPRYVNNNYVSLGNTGVEGYPNGSNARGAPGNAGGGATDYDPVANDQNSGGGGGGNGGVGGVGGWGWNLSGPTGGKGGYAFYNTSTFAALHSPSRLIMGGGGGSGTSNNGTGTPNNGLSSSGSAGGGLVIINATTISGTGTIDVSGANANNTVTRDASGGGGAGGSILIFANSGNSGITAIANGGSGGSNNPAAVGATRHGPGGGGGGGIIYSNNALNVASSVAGGANGISTGTDASNNFGAASGTVGVLTQTYPFAQLPPKMQMCQAVLPVTFLNFNAGYIASDNVKVVWTTTNEINLDHFEIERSTDASNFINAGQVNASQSSDPEHNYTFNDYLNGVNASVVYYRLKVVGSDGKISYSKIVSVRLGEPVTKISIYPNPAASFTVVSLYSDKQTVAMMRLMDNAGKQLLYRSFNINSGNNSLMIDQISNLPKGIYIVQVTMNNTLYTEKLVKK